MMSDITAPYRFIGMHSTTPKKLLTHLIPYPRLHFLLPSLAPSVSMGVACYKKNKPSDLTKFLYSRDALFTKVNDELNEDKYISVAAFYRGHKQKVSYSDVVAECRAGTETPPAAKTNHWTPNLVFPSITWKPRVDVPISGALLTSHSHIKDVLSQCIADQQEYVKKHGGSRPKIGLSYGMDEMEYTEAESNFFDMHCEYYSCIQPYASRFPDDYGGEGEESEVEEEE